MLVSETGSVHEPVGTGPAGDAIEAIYSRFMSGEERTLGPGALETLRTHLRTLIEARPETVSRSLWDTLIRLFDLSGNRQDVLAVRDKAIASGLGNEESLVRTIGIVGEALGDRAAYDALAGIGEPRKRSPELQALVAKYEHGIGRSHSAAVRARAVLEQAPDTMMARGVLVLALTDSGRVDEACRFVLGLEDTGIDAPWAVLPLLNALHRLGDRGDDFAAVTRKFLSGRVTDRTYWQLQVLSQTGDVEGARRMLGDLLREDPEDRRWNIELAKLDLESLAWASNRDHFQRVIDYPDVSRGTRERLRSALRYLDYVSSPDPSGPPDPADIVVPDSLFEYVLENHRNVLYEPVPGRVALVGCTMGPGGAERVLGMAFKGLRKRALDISLWLYSLDRVGFDDFFLGELGIERSEVTVLPDVLDVPEPFRWLPHGHGRNAYRLYLQILDRRPEVVHGWQDGVNIDLVFAAILAGVRRIVLHPHNMQPDLVHRTEIASSFLRIYRAALRRPEVHLLCVSKACRDDYLRWTGHRDATGTSVIHNGFDLRAVPYPRKARRRRELCAAHGIDPERFIVGAAFRFAEVKRPLLWVEIAALVHARLPEAHFVIFGDGELRQATQELIGRHGLQDRFTLPGRVQDVPSRIALFDAYLLTSASEGLPTAVIEAQYCGVPVVASAEGGTGECLIEGRTGHLVTSDRPDDYANAVLDVHGDARMREGVVDGAADFLDGRFAERAMIDALVALYRRERWAR